MGWLVSISLEDYSGPLEIHVSCIQKFSCFVLFVPALKVPLDTQGASYQPDNKLIATSSTQPDFRIKVDTDSWKSVWLKETGHRRLSTSLYFSAAIHCDQMSEPIPARVSNVCDTGRKAHHDLKGPLSNVTRKLS